MRSLVLLLVGLPLLMPPGMCVCQLVPCGSAQAAPVATATAPTPPAPEECCCKKRAAAAPTTGDKAGAWSQSSPDRHHPTSPDSGKHQPGCPAATGFVVEARVTLPPSPVSLHIDLAPVPVAFVAEVGTARSPAPERTQRLPIAPIFIAQCTLLI